MTSIERDLKEIGKFSASFFGLLGIVVAALPLVDLVVSALPKVIRHQDVASILASIAAYAFIGGHYVSKRRAFQIEESFPTGAALVIISVLLTIGYIGVADLLIRSSIRTSPFVEIGLILWYVVIYIALVLGLWQMAWRAYKTRDAEINYGWFE